MAPTKKKDPAQDPTDPTAAPAIPDADNSEMPGTYRDNPDKPSPESVAQVQVLPDEEG